MAKFTLSKNEKLKSEKAISLLFQKGKSLKSYPLRLKFRILSDDQVKSDKGPLLFAASIPKKLFKKAVDRNRIKRLIREAYRFNCIGLKTTTSAQAKQIELMFIYMDKELPSLDKVQDAVIKLIEKLEKEVLAN